jgi:hypothetical protein
VLRQKEFELQQAQQALEDLRKLQVSKAPEECNDIQGSKAMQDQHLSKIAPIRS